MNESGTSSSSRDERSGNPTDGGEARTSVEQLCSDLVHRWQRGVRVPVESYLSQNPDLTSDDDIFELILTEAVLRQSLGEPVSLEEFLWRFPQFEQRLRRHFSLQEELARHSTIDGELSTMAPRGPASRQIPGYEIQGELGRGGMGIVFQARDVQLGRPVALKFLPPEFSDDQARLDRFLREARTASALNHPHICTVHALGEHEGKPFIVMEFIEGKSLRRLIQQRPDCEQVARLIGQVAEALAVAHEAGVVHRDIKPENIMVREDGYVKVLDFGLARLLPTLDQPRSGSGIGTNPGALMGTVAYMSPEQADGSQATSASDIFSLGIVLYQLLCGTHPFESSSPLSTLSAIVNGRVVPPARHNPQIPRSLADLVEAMLHRDNQLRPTAVEVSTTLSTSDFMETRRPDMSATRSIFILHREREIDVLRTAVRDAETGSGAVICITGEPGIGKTTLVASFLRELATAPHSCLVARGHCSERLAGSEAYLPVIDALEDLLHTETSGSVARVMKVVAPTWYSQMLQASTSTTATEREESSRASSQPAMIREFCHLLQEASRLGTVVLFFDDVHWADLSTVDLLAHVGRVCREMRVLVLVTARPTELLLGPHPFHKVKQDLQARGACTELPVGLLNRQDVDRYLSLVFPEHTFPDDFVELVFARTEGSPLFMADLLRYLRQRNVIAESDGRWQLVRALPDLRNEIPESVRSMIQRKLEHLDRDDRWLLSVASVQGHEFDSAAVAETLERDATEVEDRLQVLDQIHGLVRRVREYEFPDRTLTLRYEFVHILYQQALYDDLQPSRRSRTSIALAKTLQKHQGEISSAAAADLACLYEVGRDFSGAARQFYLAAQNAAHVFAHREAVELARRGLRLLSAVPESATRVALETPLQTILGMQLQVTDGFASPEAGRAYTRARTLCRQSSDSTHSFPVLWGLWLFSKVRSELPKAQEMADELLALARQQQDPDLALQAYQALGMTAFCRGRPGRALAHVEQVSVLYDRRRHRTHSFMFGQDPGVICRAFGAIVLWLTGYPDQAVRESDAAIALSQELSPSSQAVAYHFAAMLHQLRREPERVRTCAEASFAIATEHEFSFWLAGANVFSGWAMAACGAPEVGLSRLRQGLRDWSATDSVTYQTYYLGLLAEVLKWQKRDDEARRVVQQALSLVEQTEERLHEAELHRLHGELLMRRESPGGMEDGDHCLRRALEVARDQRALGLELRVAVSMLRSASRTGQPNKASARLQSLCKRFSEGFDTADYQDAIQQIDLDHGT